MACGGCQNRREAAQARRNTSGNGSSSSTITQSFALVDRNGSREVFGSRLEADAANARAGYTGVVKPVAK